MKKVSTETKGEITMTMHAMETTKNEIENGYRELSRLLQGGQGAFAVKQAFHLARIDANSLWNSLKAYVSTDLNHRDTSQLLVVNALYNNWSQDQQDIFIAHAVLTLANATKNRSESVLKYMP
jgi:hypothetical protein